MIGSNNTVLFIRNNNKKKSKLPIKKINMYLIR